MGLDSTGRSRSAMKIKNFVDPDPDSESGMGSKRKGKEDKKLHFMYLKNRYFLSWKVNKL
jgi:hypothetical protein